MIYTRSIIIVITTITARLLRFKQNSGQPVYPLLTSYLFPYLLATKYLSVTCWWMALDADVKTLFALCHFIQGEIYQLNFQMPFHSLYLIICIITNVAATIPLANFVLRVYFAQQFWKCIPTNYRWTTFSYYIYAVVLHVIL